MVLNLFGSKTTKGQILKLLSEEWPLTAKQIHNALQRKYSSTASYQACHKALKELQEEGVLENQGKKFIINKEWVKKLSNYAKSLESSLTENYNSTNSKMFEFERYIDAARFMVNNFMGDKEKYPNPKNKDSVCEWKHAWPIVGISEKEHEAMKKMFKETTHYCVSEKKDYLDIFTMKYTEKMGKQIAIGKKFSAKIDTFVEGDYLLQFYFPKELEKELDKIYKELKSEKDFDMQKLLNFAAKPYKIKAIIFKNQELADSLREEAKRIVEEAK